MAEKLDDGWYWLPSEFLTDDELLAGFKTEIKPKKVDEFSSVFVNSFDLNPPVEPVPGPTETERDEDDFMAFLTRKLAHSTLHDSKFPSDYATKGSNPYPFPKYVSGFSSPSDVKDALELDLFYAVAENVARMRVNEIASRRYPPKILTPSSQLCPVTLNQQLRASNVKSEIWCRRKIGKPFNRGETKMTEGLSPPVWPTLIQFQLQSPQIPVSGMTAVYLPGNAAKKKRTGTGVFLPRNYGTNSPESRKKPVLLPDRVVHALNLNLGSIDTAAHAQSRGNANFAIEYGQQMEVNRWKDGY